MGPDDFDPRFAELLGPSAARTLARWSAAMGLSLRLSQVFVNGRSTATVAAVFERSPGRSARKLILKHDRTPEEGVASGEYARQSRAVDGAGPFRPYLTELAHEPIGVGDGSWITFQEIAGGTLDEAHVLTSLLAATTGVSLPGIVTEDLSSDRNEFVEMCSTVVGRMLADWVRTPDLQYPTMSDFLRRHLADRISPGRSLAQLARWWPGASITLDGEAGQLPNPFAFVLDPPRRLNVEIPAIVGNGHGDMHTENVLVQADGSHFWLIDLTRFQPDAPLTQDPVQLVLSVINRTLGGFTDRQRDRLLDVLVAPASRDGWSELPSWLTGLVQGTRDAGLSWIARSGLADEWRQATTLSTLACSLIYAARPSSSAANRGWFLRLAARCAAAFAGAGIEPGQPRPAHPVTEASPVTEARPDPGTGLARLCACLFDLRQRAAPCGRMDEVDRLVARGRAGEDVWADLEALAGSLEAEFTRSGLPNLYGQAITSETYQCPLAPTCGRRDRRQPGGPAPFCHVAAEPMTRMRWPA